MDFAVLQALGERWPGHVVVAGPVNPELRRVAHSISGIKWVGFVEPQYVPGLVAQYDVCIVPFVVNDRIRKSCPLKIWEYLAAGKPVVAPRIPAFEPAADVIDFAASRPDFVRLVADRLADPRPQLIEKRRQLAQSRSWDSITSSLVSVLGRALAQPHGH
jgi:glycosyltransferase involved in cell wall biosynthesis